MSGASPKPPGFSSARHLLSCVIFKGLGRFPPAGVFALFWNFRIAAISQAPAGNYALPASNETLHLVVRHNSHVYCRLPQCRESRSTSEPLELPGYSAA
jgi:hypothetical protein